MADEDQEEEIQNSKEKKGRGKIKIIAVVVIVIIIIIAAFLYFQDDESPFGDDNGKNHAPAGSVNYTKEVSVGAKVIFDASQSSDPDGDELTFTWQFDDDVTGSGAVYEREFDEAGTINGTLVVSDGDLEDVVLLSVTVTGYGPQEAPSITLYVEIIPETPLSSKKYLVSISSADPVELLENFTFEIISSENGASFGEREVVDVQNAAGNVTFLDTPVFNRMNVGDSFTITPDSTLPVVDGDEFKLYYKIGDGKQLVANELLEE